MPMENYYALYTFIIAALVILLFGLCIVGITCFSIYTGHVPYFHGKADIDIENKKVSLEAELDEDSKKSKEQQG
ncbi:hypothetical protein [Clostridium perfringens]|uniref:hypothetical protein n=2 Tax=Clostridium perfringens TaxID=1502 RepID=UPI0011C02426|nr:hypothetical protein [Clostridium perfringens]HAT4226505.1 hypothetical protein [Clostridium perfringens]HAT4263773.1 hypothetical protein [Clostridium perfringens]HBI7032832.1 hypothetical protein [Clostridium perfringens]HBI7046828.1 hypothetical protein [Clostridium perfringens]HBI7052043.1 hypothetical protein [Clostridium perfringens]